MTDPKTLFHPDARIEVEELYPDDLDPAKLLLKKASEVWFEEWVEDREEAEREFAREVDNLGRR